MAMTYEVLDALILHALKERGHPVPFFVLEHNSGVSAEAQRIALLTDRDTMRIIEGRAQALRKRGLIRPATRKAGWELVPTNEGSTT